MEVFVVFREELFGPDNEREVEKVFASEEAALRFLGGFEKRETAWADDFALYTLRSFEVET